MKFFLPGMIHVLETADRVRMENQLTQVALALAAFKADHRMYPAALADLSPAYLKTAPNDLFFDKPLIYSKTAAGYLLYSVGPNMVDDGGKSEKPADDLAVHVP